MNPFADLDANFDPRRLVSNQASRTMPVPTAPPPKKSKNFLIDNISTAGGILGGLGGGAIGGLFGAGVGAVPGAGIGGAIGSGLGQSLENLLTGDNITKDVGKEALLGGIFSAGPIKLAKLGLGIPAALAARGGSEVAGMGAKSLVEGGAKALAGDAAEQVGGKALKTGFTGRLTTAGNKTLASQYGTISKPVARATNPLDTIGKLADMGILKPVDAERIGRSITGNDGILTQQVAKAIGSAGKVPLESVPRVLDDAIVKNSLHGLPKADSLSKMVNAHLEGIQSAGGTPDSVMSAIRSLEGQAADLAGKGGTYHLATSTDKQLANVLKTVTGELKDQLYNAAGANKNISSVLTPELRDQLLQLHPKSNEWARFVNQKVMKANSIGELRNIQSPFVKIQKIIDEGDINDMTFGGRVGNSFGGPGGIMGKAADIAANLTKDPAARFSGKAMRDIGTGEIANQSSKGFGGIATSLGAINALSGGLGGGSASAQPDNTLEGAMTMGQPQDPSMDLSGPQGADGYLTGMGGSGGGMTGGNNLLGQQQQQASSPYSKEALMYDLNRDPKNAAKYIEYYSQLADIFTPQEKPKSLNSTQVQQQNTAISGMKSLEDIAGFINSNPNAPKQDMLPGFTRGFTGTGAYHTAIQNATDSIGRLRSGGAINSDEEKRFRSFLPSAVDDPETIKYKLNALNTIFQRFADPQAAASTDPLTAQTQGGY